MRPAREAFLDALAPPLKERWRAWPRLAAELEGAHAAAAERWPELAVSADDFAAYLAARAEPEPPADGAAFPHAAELYLACAIAAGEGGALRLFERDYTPTIAPSVARFRLAPDALDELVQTLRCQLLLAEPGRPPRIGDYSGRGDLAAWLRVAAVRAAIKLHRGRREQGDEGEALERAVSSEPTPEGRYLTAEGRAAFREALRGAIRSLAPQEQNVLRQHHLDQLTLDELGALYRVHRTTVAYWLERARTRLFKRTRAALVERAKLSASECDSLLGHAQSQLGVTLRNLFD